MKLALAALLLTAVAAQHSHHHTNHSCQGKCGEYKSHWECQCNSECVRHKDCCKDWSTVCPPGPSPSPSPPPGPPVGPTGGPEQFHLSLTDEPTEMTVAFATAPSFYGADQQLAMPSCSMGTSPGKRPQLFTGFSRTYTDGGWNGMLHVVTFSGLAADGTTRYYYSCDGSPEFSFVSPPARGSLPLTVAVVADLGENCDKLNADGSQGCGNATIAALAAATKKSEFDMLVHAGDIAYTDGHQDVWDTYLREMEPIAANIPYQVCVGNHEHYYDFSGYLHRFEMPGSQNASRFMVNPAHEVETTHKRNHTPPLARAPDNLWFSYDFGGVHWLAYSTEHNLEQQIPFIRADLAAAAAPARRKSTPWIVMYGHKPLYCSTDAGFACEASGFYKGVAPLLEPLLKEFGVDLFLAGHLHNYERTLPVYNREVVSSSYNNPNATVHVVVGMAGDDEGQTDKWMSPNPHWSAVRNAKLGYARLSFLSAAAMRFEYVLSNTGEVADTFVLTKQR